MRVGLPQPPLSGLGAPVRNVVTSVAWPQAITPEVWGNLQWSFSPRNWKHVKELVTHKASMQLKHPSKYAFRYCGRKLERNISNHGSSHQPVGFTCAWARCHAPLQKAGLHPVPGMWYHAIMQWGFHRKENLVLWCFQGWLTSSKPENKNDATITVRKEGWM